MQFTYVRHCDSSHLAATLYHFCQFAVLKQRTRCIWQPTHLFIDFRKAFAIHFINHLRHANHIATRILDGHTEQRLGPIAGLRINLTIETLILKGNLCLIYVGTE